MIDGQDPTTLLTPTLGHAHGGAALPHGGTPSEWPAEATSMPQISNKYPVNTSGKTANPCTYLSPTTAMQNPLATVEGMTGGIPILR